MQDSIVCEPLRFTSADKKTRIHAHIWHDPHSPRPKGIVQIVHGMAEHIMRYDDFARFLVTCGYAACGHDQIGHGASCSPDRWGKIPAETGEDIMLADIDTLRRNAADKIGRDIPYIVFGHSMGSYLTRAYITRRGSGLDGAIICGTGHVVPLVSKLGNMLARRTCRKEGEDALSSQLDALVTGSYASSIPGAETSADWLSYNADNVSRYIADERCGFPFSAGGYAMLTDLTAEVCSPKSAARIPKALPLLYIAGDADPVGNGGKGVEKAASQARDAGVTDVQIKIYTHMRHEILNEDGREQVYNDVVAWLDAHARQAANNE